MRSDLAEGATARLELSSRGADLGPAAVPRASRTAALDLVGPIVDRLWMAILVLDREGRVLLANAAALRILEQRDGLCCRDDRLVASRPADTRALQREIAAIVGRGESRAPGYGMAKASRPSGLAPYVLLVAPFASPAAEIGPAPEAAPAALLIVSDLELPLPDCGRYLGLAFEMTEAEVEVSLGLLDGQTPSEIAHMRGVRLTTIRSQVKAIFAKTGTTRQSELVKLLSRLPRLR